MRSITDIVQKFIYNYIRFIWDISFSLNRKKDYNEVGKSRSKILNLNRSKSECILFVILAK